MTESAGLVRINLGCGTEHLDGYVNVDTMKDADVVWDLNRFPYPFDDGTAGEIRMLNVLEHLQEPVRVLEEVHRILQPGATVFIRVPHFSSLALPSDPSHLRGFSSRTFRFFTRDAEYPLSSVCFAHYRFEIKFANVYRLQSLFNRWAAWYARRQPDKYEATGLCRVFPAWSLDVWLTR